MGLFAYIKRSNTQSFYTEYVGLYSSWEDKDEKMVLFIRVENVISYSMSVKDYDALKGYINEVNDCDECHICQNIGVGGGDSCSRCKNACVCDTCYKRINKDSLNVACPSVSQTFVVMLRVAAVLYHSYITILNVYLIAKKVCIYIADRCYSPHSTIYTTDLRICLMVLAFLIFAGCYRWSVKVYCFDFYHGFKNMRNIIRDLIQHVCVFLGGGKLVRGLFTAFNDMFNITCFMTCCIICMLWYRFCLC